MIYEIVLQFKILNIRYISKYLVFLPIFFLAFQDTAF